MKIFGSLLLPASLLGSLVGASVASAASGPELGEAELTQLFEVFDANGNGVITKSELGNVITSFRVGFEEGELDKMMVAYDASGDGVIQSDEFSNLMRGFGSETDNVTAQMERAFLRFDANRDGGLNAQEVKALMEASGKTITLREAKRIVFEGDNDGNGRIDTAEFSQTEG